MEEPKGSLQELFFPHGCFESQAINELKTNIINFLSPSKNWRPLLKNKAIWANSFTHSRDFVIYLVPDVCIFVLAQSKWFF